MTGYPGPAISEGDESRTTLPFFFLNLLGLAEKRRRITKSQS